MHNTLTLHTYHLQRILSRIKPPSLFVPQRTTTNTNPTITNHIKPFPSTTTQTRTMRLPYAPSEPPADAPPSTTETYHRIAARRHPRPLIPLDLALLHSPPVADGWNSFLGAIRSQTIVDQAVLELAIARVGALTRAAWEWRAHATLAAKAGVSRRALEWVLRAEPVTERVVAEGTLSREQAAVVRYADAMTRDVDVGEDVFAELRDVFGERETVEITAAVAAYNCVSRFLVALDVGEMNGKELEVPEEAK